MIEMAENGENPPSLFKTRIFWGMSLDPCFKFTAINISYEKIFLGHTPFF
jgi:hypothetical protein|tara:strand:+ start:1022 stop:1171 length:150 start_codon:yes stop_codon:yes gene_type:complete